MSLTLIETALEQLRQSRSKSNYRILCRNLIGQVSTYGLQMQRKLFYNISKPTVKKTSPIFSEDHLFSNVYTAPQLWL